MFTHFRQSGDHPRENKILCLICVISFLSNCSILIILIILIITKFARGFNIRGCKGA